MLKRAILKANISLKNSEHVPTCTYFTLFCAQEYGFCSFRCIMSQSVS